jgi:hypothetical protein
MNIVAIHSRTGAIWGVGTTVENAFSHAVYVLTDAHGVDPESQDFERRRKDLRKNLEYYYTPFSAAEIQVSLDSDGAVLHDIRRPEMKVPVTTKIHNARKNK